jgi:hypothetical protein
MSNPSDLPSEILAAFDLASDDLGAIEELGVVQTSQAQGKGLSTVLAAMLATLSPLTYVEVSSATATACGATLLEARHTTGAVLQGVVAPDGQVDSGASGSELIEADGVHWQLAGPGNLLRLQTPMGSLLFGTTKDGKRIAVPILQQAALPDVSFEPLAVASTALLPQGAAPWLVEAVAQRCELSELVYPAASAAGLALRHGPIVSADDAIARLLAGLEPELSLAHKWFQGLSTRQVRDVADVAIAEAQELRDELNVLAEPPEIDESDWQFAMTDLCVRREALEGVRALLHFRGLGDGLDVAAAEIDRAGLAFVASLHRTVRLPNPILAAAGPIDPSAWWCRRSLEG